MNEWMNEWMNELATIVIWLQHSFDVQVYLFLAWTLALLCCAPQLVVWETKIVIPESGFTQCEPNYNQSIFPSETVGKSLYGIYHLATVFWIPFTVISACYCCIAIKLVKLSLNPIGRAEESQKPAPYMMDTAIESRELDDNKTGILSQRYVKKGLAWLKPCVRFLISKKFESGHVMEFAVGFDCLMPKAKIFCFVGEQEY